MKARLRASRIKTEGEDYTCGHRLGREWASKSAEWEELRSLSLHDPDWSEIEAPAAWIVWAAGLKETVFVNDFWAIHETMPGIEDARVLLEYFPTESRELEWL